MLKLPLIGYRELLKSEPVQTVVVELKNRVQYLYIEEICVS